MAQIAQQDNIYFELSHQLDEEFTDKEKEQFRRMYVRGQLNDCILHVKLPEKNQLSKIASFYYQDTGDHLDGLFISFVDTTDVFQINCGMLQPSDYVD